MRAPGRWSAAVLVLLAASGWGAPAAAAEMQAEAPVVDVVPVNASGAGGCQPPKPWRGAGLTELLAWDLRASCSAASVSAYRVYFRWDGRTHSRVMAHHPGATVPVRVTLD